MKLKNAFANSLMIKRKITINGIEVNLWHSGIPFSRDLYEGWNKIKSYTDLNFNNLGESGDIVFTGIMQLPRKEIADYAVKLGFKVHSAIAQHHDFLIFGTDNVSPSKMAAAIEFNKKGANIKFIDELTFLQIISTSLT